MVVVAMAAALAAGALFWFNLPSVEPLRHAHPPITALMEARAEEARETGRAVRRNQHWVPLSHISPWLQKAVVNSEDARFYEHDGVDVTQTRLALREAMERGKLGRGASTLTQQLAKNLWLGEERTILRKLRELVLARRLERLGKRRVLELYLNVAEWGPGIYGADAAARIWFGKPAWQLRPEEAAVLAAMLPAPRKRNPMRPSWQLRKRAWEILDLYQANGQISPDEMAQAWVRMAGILGPMTFRSVEHASRHFHDLPQEGHRP